jgi:spore maturation protein CgeB
MNILITGELNNRYSLESSYLRAFETLGCRVFGLDLSEALGYLRFATKTRFSYRLLLDHLAEAISPKLVRMALKIRPDLVFIFKDVMIKPQALKRIKGSSNALIFHFNPDNPLLSNLSTTSPLSRACLPLYDCVFTWSRSLIEGLKGLKAKRVEYLPFACDPYIHYPIEPTQGERKVFQGDVIFVGTWCPEREKILEQIADFEPAIWGNYWQRIRRGSPLRGFWRGKGIWGKDVSKAYTLAKIALNILRHQNSTAHNMRTFEILACRGFQIATRSPEQSRLLKEDKEFVCFSSISELREKISRYLKDEAQREIIREAGYAGVLRHTYTKRAEFLISVYDRLKR